MSIESRLPRHLLFVSGRLGALVSNLPHPPVADQLPALLVPQAELQRFQTGEHRDGFDSLEKRVGLVTLLEIVVGNARAEVMDVVKADVPGEPLQNSRQLGERAALKRRRRVIPGVSALPVNVL